MTDEELWDQAMLEAEKYGIEDNDPTKDNGPLSGAVCRIWDQVQRVPLMASATQRRTLPCPAHAEGSCRQPRSECATPHPAIPS